MTAAKVMAGMIHDVLEDPSQIAKMKEERAATPAAAVWVINAVRSAPRVPFPL